MVPVFWFLYKILKKKKAYILGVYIFVIKHYHTANINYIISRGVERRVRLDRDHRQLHFRFCRLCVWASITQLINHRHIPALPAARCTSPCGMRSTKSPIMKLRSKLGDRLSSVLAWRPRQTGRWLRRCNRPTGRSGRRRVGEMDARAHGRKRAESVGVILCKLIIR